MKRSWLAAALLMAVGVSGAEGEARRLLITVEKGEEPLTAVDLVVTVDKKRAEVLRVHQPQELPVQLAVLIADSSGPEVAQSLEALQRFVKSLPEGSEVMVGYLRAGAIEVRQPFTADRAAAAAAFRIPRQATDVTFDLGQSVEDVLDYFPERPGRGQILYIGDGPFFDSSSSYQQDAGINRALRGVQEKGVVVWAIHVGEVGVVELGKSVLSPEQVLTAGVRC